MTPSCAGFPLLLADLILGDAGDLFYGVAGLWCPDHRGHRPSDGRCPLCLYLIASETAVASSTNIRQHLLRNYRADARRHADDLRAGFTCISMVAAGYLAAPTCALARARAQKTGWAHKFDFPAAFRSVREGLGTWASRQEATATRAEIRIRRAGDASDGEPVREIVGSYNVSHSTTLRLTGELSELLRAYGRWRGMQWGRYSPVVIALNDMDRATISTLKADLHG